MSLNLPPRSQHDDYDTSSAEARLLQQIRSLTRSTLSHYEQHAAPYWEGTRDHDVTQNIEALLNAIEGPAPYRILDFGCGPGRDLQHFKTRGHEVIGLDGSHAFAEMARQHTACEVWLQDFIALDLPATFFDGVFANASLFHTPRSALQNVLGALHRTLKPGGVLFCSNPRGNNQEGLNGLRYGCYYDYDNWHAEVSRVGFAEIHHYYRPPGLPREQQPWLATVWRKPPSGDK